MNFISFALHFGHDSASMGSPMLFTRSLRQPFASLVLTSGTGVLMDVPSQVGASGIYFLTA